MPIFGLDDCHRTSVLSAEIRSFPIGSVGMIRGARETPAVDRVGGSGLASRLLASCERLLFEAPVRVEITSA
jgi:hypothetical protein